MILTGSNVAKALIKAFGSAKAGAEAIGVDESTLLRWKARKATPQRRHIGKAKKAIDGKIAELNEIAGELRA